MRLARRFMGSEGMKMGGVYFMPAKKYKQKFFLVMKVS
jgi:hypothetical protein